MCDYMFLRLNLYIGEHMCRSLQLQVEFAVGQNYILVEIQNKLFYIFTIFGRMETFVIL